MIKISIQPFILCYILLVRSEGRIECICKHTKNKIWYVSGPQGKKSWYVSHHKNECLEMCICKHTIYFLNAFKFIHCDVCRDWTRSWKSALEKKWTSWMHRQLHGFTIVASKGRGGVVKRLRNLDRVGKKGGGFSCQFRFFQKPIPLCWFLEDKRHFPFSCYCRHPTLPWPPMGPPGEF